MFVVVAIPAFLLSLLVKYGARAGAPEPQLYIVTVLEYAILIVDSLILLYRLFKGAWISLKETE